MREIIFRGKSIKSGNWVYGQYLFDPTTSKAVIVNDWMPLKEIFSVEINPETLGQYTGLKDATKWDNLSEEDQKEWIVLLMIAEEWEGNKIYEGDIVEFKADYCDRDRNGWHKGVIEWDQDHVGYVIKVPGYDDPFIIDDETDEFNHKAKVIGNVSDHTELLKVPESR